MSTRRMASTGLALLCGLIGGGLLAQVASAAQLRPYLSSFSAETPGGVAVNQETGTVYVAEDDAGTVGLFDSAGGPPAGGLPSKIQNAFTPTGAGVGLAVDNACYYHQPRLSGSACEAFDPSNGDLYVPSVSGAVRKFALNLLTKEYEVVKEIPFQEPGSVAVDHEGNVYVPSFYTKAVTEFSPSGAVIATIEQSTIEHPYSGIAVGTPGVLYIGEDVFFPSGVAKLEAGPKGELESQKLLDGEGGAVALDGQENVLVDDLTHVAEYNSAGALLGVWASGRVGGSLGIAVADETQHAYVSSRSGGSVAIFGPPTAVPVVTTGPVSNGTLTSTSVSGEVNPEGAAISFCEFEYGTSAAYGASVPCVPAKIGSGNAPVTVTAELKGLQPGVVYHYRLVAANANSPSEHVLGKDQMFATGAHVEEESVSDVTADSATFEASIDPVGQETTYHFEYGSTTAYGSSAPVPDARLGREALSVSQHVQGLQPGSVYHFRVVAHNADGTTDGEDQTITTQPTGSEFALPDGRHWEMVTPVDKHGANVVQIDESGAIQASVNGNAMVYLMNLPTEAEPPGYESEVQTLSRRGPDGWVAEGIEIPHEEATGVALGNGVEYRLFSEDVSRGVVHPFGPFDPALSVEASEQTEFLRTVYADGNVEDPCSSSCYRPLLTGKAGYANLQPGTVLVKPGCEVLCGPRARGATPDLSHIVIGSEVALTAEGGPGLYEWAAGQLTYIGKGIFGSSEERSARHSISDDGSRVVFTGESEGQSGLLLRETDKGKTVRLGEGEFQIASSDDSRVFFLSGGDLDECEMVEEAGGLVCKLSNLTPTGGSVRGVVGASEDGSYVYFVAAGALAEGAVPGGENLYARHDGTTRLVGVLSDEDSPDWELQDLTSRVSPDGRWLAFMSSRDLTGYVTRDAVSGVPDEEVYLYDAGTGRLVCASCDPSGARPVGIDASTGAGTLILGEHVWSGNWFAANIPGWTPFELTRGRYQSRALSDSGRLFFNSNDALVPQDVNGTVDVYEYEPSSIGDCSASSVTFSERSGGCVGLVSSGTSAEESAFLDASGSGGDVFFMTQAKLSSSDRDTALDIYDAHECSAASPCLPASVALPPPCDTGDACKASPTPQPTIFGEPSSATFSGAGNLAPSTSASTVKPKPKSRAKKLTRAQKLKRALRSCPKKPEKRRSVCERRAKTRYAAKGSAKANATKKGRG